MPSFGDAVAALGEPIHYAEYEHGRWMVRMTPLTPVRYAYTPVAITGASVCWEAVEEQTTGGLFSKKKSEVRTFRTASLPQEVSCGCVIPEDDHFALGFGPVSLELVRGGARDILKHAVGVLRSHEIPVRLDSWMRQNGYELGIAGRGATYAD